MSIFSSMPELPVVPIPVPGEALGSWLAAIADIYGIPLRDYLQRLGVVGYRTTPNFDRDIVIRPPLPILEAIQRDTGVSPEIIRRMTFSGLDPEMEEACLRHFHPCEECEKQASQRADRPVRLLSARAPWHVVCPYHPPNPHDWELGADLPIAAIYVQVRTIIESLDKGAFDQAAFEAAIHGKRWEGTMRPGILIRLAHLLNAHVAVKVMSYDDMRDMAEFAILRVYRETEDHKPEPLAESQRNSLAVSLLFAWQFARYPDVTLAGYCYVGKCVARQDTPARIRMYRLLDVLLDVMPGAIAISFLARRASKRWILRDDGQPYTGLAFHAVQHLSNMPEFVKRLRRAHNNHVAIGQMLLHEIRGRGQIKTSKFETPYPFYYKDVGVAARSSLFVGLARQARFKRPGYARLGLSSVPPRTKKRRAKIDEFNAPDPISAPVDMAPYLKAVQTALNGHGPMKGKMTAKERTKLMNKLLMAAMAELEAERRETSPSNATACRSHMPPLT